jgi:RHS repeat-associated protein
LTGLGTDEFYQRTDSVEGTVNYLTDAIGSTLALTDTNGNITTEYTYDPFGNVTASGSLPITTNPYQFTGRENDGTGLYYYRARYYSPVFHRFLSQDPASQVPSYIYAGDNPVTSLDPTGTVQLNPTNFVTALGNIIYGETTPIHASQPGIFTGRTFLGISLTNGFLSYGKPMCTQGYVQLPYGGCYLRLQQYIMTGWKNHRRPQHLQ